MSGSSRFGRRFAENVGAEVVAGDGTVGTVLNQDGERFSGSPPIPSRGDLPQVVRGSSARGGERHFAVRVLDVGGKFHVATVAMLYATVNSIARCA